MVKGIRLDIEPPHAGWAMIRLTASGVHLEFAASNTPWDSIGELAKAVADLLSGSPEQVVAWNTEPEEYEFQFVTEGGRTRLEVHLYPDSRRRWRHAEVPVAVVEGDTISTVRALWRGLRRLQGAVSVEEFAEAWHYPFPASTVEWVGEQLRGQAARGTPE